MKESRNIWETVRTSSHPNVVAYSDPSTHVSAKSFISLFRILHRRPVLLLTPWIASTHFLFTPSGRGRERETEDFACSAYRTASFRVLHIPQTNERLSSLFLCNRWWTDGMVFLSMKFFRSLGWFISPSIESIVFSLSFLNFRDRNCILSCTLFHRWSISFKKFRWNGRIVTI